MLYLDPVQMSYQEVNVHTMNFIQQDELTSVQQDASQTDNPSTGGSLFGNPIILMLIVLALFMLLLRPRQDKEGDKFRNALQKEQDVVTSSGIFGKIKDIDEVSVTLEIAKGMTIKVDKRYVNPVPTPQPAKPEKPSRRRKKDPSKDEKA